MLTVEQLELVYRPYSELLAYLPVFAGTGPHYELCEGSAKLPSAQLLQSMLKRQLDQLSRLELHRGSALYY